MVPQESPQEVEEAKALLAANQLEFDSQIKYWSCAGRKGAWLRVPVSTTT